MSDGEWRIWQNDAGGRSKCDHISVRETADSLEPYVEAGRIGIYFRYSNGQQTYYPWTSIVRAEYDPPTNP